MPHSCVLAVCFCGQQHRAMSCCQLNSTQSCPSMWISENMLIHVKKQNENSFLSCEPGYECVHFLKVLDFCSYTLASINKHMLPFWEASHKDSWIKSNLAFTFQEGALYLMACKEAKCFLSLLFWELSPIKLWPNCFGRVTQHFSTRES